MNNKNALYKIFRMLYRQNFITHLFSILLLCIKVRYHGGFSKSFFFFFFFSEMYILWIKTSKTLVLELRGRGHPKHEIEHVLNNIMHVSINNSKTAAPTKVSLTFLVSQTVCLKIDILVFKKKSVDNFEIAYKIC